MKRKFVYYLKLLDGRLLHAEGADPAEAARAAGVKLAEVKRHMPVDVVLTEEEIAARAQRFKMLRKKAELRKAEQAEASGEVIDTLEEETE